MSSRRANSLEVELVNGTSSSTLRFVHRTGFLSSLRRELEILTPPSGDTISSFVFLFEEGTNEFIVVEYKVEMENQVEVENEPDSMRRRPSKRTYNLAGVRIDSTMLRDHSKIIVVDSEVAQNGAVGSAGKKFKLQKKRRAVAYEAGWLVTLVMTLYALFKYVLSGFRNMIPATPPPAPDSEPPAPVAEPPAAVSERSAEGTDTGYVQRVSEAV